MGPPADRCGRSFASFELRGGFHRSARLALVSRARGPPCRRCAHVDASRRWVAPAKRDDEGIGAGNRRCSCGHIRVVARQRAHAAARRSESDGSRPIQRVDRCDDRIRAFVRSAPAISRPRGVDRVTRDWSDGIWAEPAVLHSSAARNGGRANGLDLCRRSVPWRRGCDCGRPASRRILLAISLHDLCRRDLLARNGNARPPAHARTGGA